MTPTEPLPLHHSWPLMDADERFDLGRLLDDPRGAGDTSSARPMETTPGLWACDLADNRLHWSREVFRLFGMDDTAVPARIATVSLYAEASRAAMERLRAHAIRHRRGFTLDVAIFPHDAAPLRWLRLIAAPVCDGGRVVRLHGCKSDVTHLYGR
ncbi:PAS domain-containing protein [Sphingomonas insulae]|uniref:PAS domain-containing protein n=1 Tax=Sphingomonas insulae TaxID=424800 RepID=A0ABP3T7S8_9SPHN|nr:hypothetical protein [Sphingomonas insulae]NIJ29454.1 PAS domain-containing protein [Sphingomonas insulae]